jgi:hypothetical protein
MEGIRLKMLKTPLPRMILILLQNINIKTRVLFTKFSKHHPKSAIERFNLPRENGGRGFSNLEILQHNQIVSLKNYFLNSS